MEASDDLIKDFDNEVANRCKLIREGAENVSNNMLNALDLTLLSIPECVRKMTVKALVQNFNGDMQKAVQYFAPQKSTPKKKHHNGKSRNSPNLPLSNSQTQSLSELLKKKASEQSNATPNNSIRSSQRTTPKSPTCQRTPIKSPTRTPTKSPMSSHSKSPPRTPTKTPPRLPTKATLKAGK